MLVMVVVKFPCRFTCILITSSFIVLFFKDALNAVILYPLNKARMAIIPSIRYPVLENFGNYDLLAVSY